MTTEPRISAQTGQERGRSDRSSSEWVANRLKRPLLAVIGSVLLVRGFGRRSLQGMGTALVGGWLLSRAVEGRSRTDGSQESRTTTDRREEDRTETADEAAISRTVTVGKPAEELYEIWRDPDQFSRIMGHFSEVTAVGEDRLRWTVPGPRGRDLSWEARIVEEEPGEFLRWETPADALLPNEGSVRFRQAPGDRGTQVTLSARVDPPGGALGNAALRRLEMAPETLAGEALRRFKRLAESEEIPTLEGNPSARGEGDLV